jgi:hypothetical protein
LHINFELMHLSERCFGKFALLWFRGLEIWNNQPENFRGTLNKPEFCCYVCRDKLMQQLD